MINEREQLKLLQNQEHELAVVSSQLEQDQALLSKTIKDLNMLKETRITHVEVLQEMAGAMRNLAACGGEDVCKEMVGKGAVGVMMDLGVATVMSLLL